MRALELARARGELRAWMIEIIGGLLMLAFFIAIFAGFAVVSASLHIGGK